MELIDSKYTREKYKELGLEFTDWQKAAIIWNKPLPQQKRLDALKDFAVETSDLELKKQITERVNYEEKLLEYFKHNPNNDFIYVVKKSKEGYDYGAFYIFDMAFEHAKKYAREDNVKMCIKKVQIVKGMELPQRKIRCGWNPNLFPEKEIEEEDCDYSDGEMGEITIPADGEIRYWWSSESTKEEYMMVDEFDKSRFESKFIKLPYVHEAGMLVKYVPTGEIGVLATGKDDWDNFMQRVDKGLYVDYSDNSHEMYSLSDKGYWIHDHICPFLLEEAFIPEEILEPKDKAMYDAMQALSSFWAGNRSKEQEMKALQTAKEYARVVHECSLKETGESEPTEIWHILH